MIYCNRRELLSLSTIAIVEKMNIRWIELEIVKRCSFCMVTSIVLLCQSMVTASFAEDWPGLLGPNRNGHVEDESIERVARWSNKDNSLKIVWKMDAGHGYAGAAIVNGQTVLFDRDGSKDRIRLAKMETGEVIWESTIVAEYRGGIDSDVGPRSVPTIAGEYVICYTAAGSLVCLDTKNGKVNWNRPLRREFQADDGYFGAGSSPLVIGDTIIVNVGGKKGGIVAVETHSGKTLWTATDYDASYAAPIAVMGDVPFAIVPTRLKTVAVELRSGKELWEVPFGQRGPTVNAATPISVSGSRYFLTASYGIGSVLLDAGDKSVAVVQKSDSMSSQYATPVLANGAVFGCDGREDGGAGAYKCLDAQSLNIKWEKAGMPMCHTVAMENLLLVCGIDGQFWSVNANTKAWDPIWESSPLPPGNYRPLPAVVDDSIVVRSTGSNAQWYCLRRSAN